MCALRVRVSQQFPALVQLADEVEAALGTVKRAAQQLSQGGVSRDAEVLAALPRLPILDILRSLEALQTELAAAWAASAVDASGGSGPVEPLGMRDRQVVAQAMDLVMLFEVLPRLAPGVGVPLSRRLSSEVSSVVSSLMRRPSGRRTWEPDQQTTLGDLVRRLTAIADRGVGAGDVAGVISGKHHSDVVAALLQLAYAPRPPAPGSPLALEGRYYVECDDGRRAEHQRAFTRIFNSSSPYLMLETLTSLLNEAGRPAGPRWMAVVCSRFLARVVMKYTRDGARICLDFLVGHDDQLSTAKLERVARLLLSPPSGADAAGYYAAVVPQLVALAAAAPAPAATSMDASGAPARDSDVVDRIRDAPAAQDRIVQAAAYALRELAPRNRDVFRRLVAEPVSRPLQRWFSPRTQPAGATDFIDPVARGLAGTGGQRRPPAIEVVGEAAEAPGPTHPTVAASAEELGAVLHMLQQMVLGGVAPAELVAELVCPLLAPLVHWYAFEIAGRPSAEPPTVGSVAGVLREVLAAALCALPRGGAAAAAVLQVIQLARDSDDVTTQWPGFCKGARGTELVWRTASTSGDDQRLAPVDALIGLLGSPELRTVAGDVFLALLREQDALRAEMPRGDADLERRWWLVSQAALAAVDRLGPAVLTRHADILAFVLGVLDRHDAAASGDDDGDGHDSEITLALMLLAQIMAASEEAGFGAASDKPSGGADDLPRIEWSSESLQLLRSIQTRVKQLGGTEGVAGAEVAQLCSQVALPIALVLALHGDTAALPESRSAAPSDDRRVAEALRSVRSDLVPVRAHGIIELRNLVLARSPAITENGDNLAAAIAVFVDMVGEDDSFVYLNAIRGLAALADLHLRRFLPQLVDMYTAPAADLDRRLRVGEALLQSVQRAGALLADCAPLLVPPLLAAIASREDSPVAVHSALSILAQVAHTYPLALQQWGDHVTAAVHDVLVAHAADSEYVP
ncbi:hypothetical protein IWQ56_001377, partial [Coemansia nantahalensis]